MSKPLSRVARLCGVGFACCAYWFATDTSAIPPTLGTAVVPHQSATASTDDAVQPVVSSTQDPASVFAVGTLEAMEALARAHPELQTQQRVAPMPDYEHAPQVVDVSRVKPWLHAAQPVRGLEVEAPLVVVPSPGPTEPEAPPLTVNFIGQTDNNTIIPPDTMGAVGPNHVFSFLNSGRTIYNKVGGLVAAQQNLPVFWGVLGTGIGQPARGPFDPRVIYDQYSGRYVVACCGFANDGSGTAWVLVGISQTSDPTGAWNMFGILVSTGVHVGHWFDFPGLGVDPDNVIISGNMFPQPSGAFVHSDVYVIRKASLIAGGSLVLGTDYSLHHNPCPTLGTGFTFMPCHTYGQAPGNGVNYLCDQGWVAGPGAPTLRYIRITPVIGIGASATLDCMADANFVEVAGYNYNRLDATQPACTFAINTNDARMRDRGVVRNGKIFYTHHVGTGAPPYTPNPPATRCEVRWYQIDPALIVAPGLPTQQGTVGHATLAYYYPSMAVNKDECIMLGFSASDGTTFAGGYYTGRLISDPLGTMQPVGLLKAGEDSYFKRFGTTRNRWGDYSGSCVDPVDDATMWTVQEYARPEVGGACPTADTGRWGTWWGAMPCPAIPPPQPPCSLCGPGPHWMDSPPCPGGVDNIPSGALVGIDNNLDCVADMSIVMNGPVLVRRSNPQDDSFQYPGTRPVDSHLDVIDTEIVSMSLTGGGVILTAGATNGAIPLSPTRGAIAEQAGDPNLADSFFDVFFEVDLGGGNRLYNQTPVQLSSVITCIPPYQDYFHLTGCVPLYTSPIPGQGTHMGNLVSARHDPYPTGACCYPGGGCQTTANETTCLQSGGNYQGDGTDCDTSPCGNVVPPGQDCWTTECGSTHYDFENTPIPCGFFDPGSEPFDGLVLLGGGDPGDIDTVVQRLGSLSFGAILPDTQNVPIEIVSLNLVSCAPISVRYCNGQPDEQWSVQVDLSVAPPPPPGTMTVSKTHANGGTFDSQFFVQPRFTFTRISAPGPATRVFDTGAMAIPPMLLNSTQPAPWVHQATIPIGPTICGINFVPGVQETGTSTPGSTCVPTAQCTKPVGHAGPGHLHVTGHISVPCPCGACCDPANGSCVEISSPTPGADCFALGRVYKGDGTSCVSADGDTIPDAYETNNCCAPGACPPNGLCSTPTDPTRADTDGDGLNDDVDPAPCNRCVPLGAPGRPAICDQFDLTLPGDGDCDNDGICDLCEIQAGTSNDCNRNGVPDECEPDCNSSGTPDDYDITCGTSLDVNGNNIPDECEGCTCLGDVNGDGTVDGRDIRCFILCLLYGSGSGCNCRCADVDLSGAVDTLDVNPFVILLLEKPSDCRPQIEVAPPVIGEGPGRLNFNVSVGLGGPFGNADADGEGSLRLDLGAQSFFDVVWHSDGNPAQMVPAFDIQIPGQTPIQDLGASTRWTLNGFVDVLGDPGPAEPDATVQVTLVGPPLAQLGDPGARYDLDTLAPSQAVVQDPQAFGGLPPGTPIPIIRHPVKIKKYCVYRINIIGGIVPNNCPPGWGALDTLCVECDARQKGGLCPPTGFFIIPAPAGINPCVLRLQLFGQCGTCFIAPGGNGIFHAAKFVGWAANPKP